MDFKIQVSTIYFLYLNYKDTDILFNSRHKEVEVAILISDKVNFKTISITRDKEGHLIMIGSIHQEAVIILHIYAPNTKTLPTAHKAWCSCNLPCQLHPNLLSHTLLLSPPTQVIQTSFLEPLHPEGLCIPLTLPCL